MFKFTKFAKISDNIDRESNLAHEITAFSEQTKKNLGQINFLDFRRKTVFHFHFQFSGHFVFFTTNMKKIHDHDLLYQKKS
jgi:hypothetical protein